MLVPFGYDVALFVTPTVFHQPVRPFDHFWLGDEDSLPEEIQSKEKVLEGILQEEPCVVSDLSCCPWSKCPGLKMLLKRVAFSCGVVSVLTSLWAFLRCDASKKLQVISFRKVISLTGLQTAYYDSSLE